MDGDEIVQMYISLHDAKIFRPTKELKGFVRVCLQAGETKKVEIAFDAYTFRYFNVRSNSFGIEGGLYEIQVGASCQDIRLRGTIQIKDTGMQNPYADSMFDCYKNCDLICVSDSAFQALLGRSIPEHVWNRQQSLGINDTVRQLVYAKNPIARLAYKILTRKVNQAIANGKPDLNLLFIYNIPFRGMAKMMGGMVSNAMAEDILMMCNGHGFRGFCRLIRDFFMRPKTVC